jgi:O-antigen ligase
MPPAIWTNLPGRELLAEADTAVGLKGIWRPITMVPYSSWNAFYSLFTPLAVLILGLQLMANECRLLLYLLLIFALVGCLMALMQVVGPPDGMLYLYQVTNNGAAVGPFSNRNHQAIFLACIFPMLAVYISASIKSVEQFRFRTAVALVSGLAVIPLLLVTGSRAGMLIGLIAIASTFYIYRKPKFTSPTKRKAKRVNFVLIFGAIAIVILALLTIGLARAEAFDRLFQADRADELRFQIWGPILSMGWKYFPIGSGFGSFVEVYQIDEPFSTLSPNYVNHAHNDFLEIFMTGGIFGLTFLILAIIAWGRRTIQLIMSQSQLSQKQLFGRLGSAVLLLFGLGSVADYPIRTPLMMAFAVIAILWMQQSSENFGRSARKKGMEIESALV